MGKVYLIRWHGKKQRGYPLTDNNDDNFLSTPRGLFELDFFSNPWRASQKIGSCTLLGVTFFKAELNFTKQSNLKQALTRDAPGWTYQRGGALGRCAAWWLATERTKWSKWNASMFFVFWFLTAHFFSCTLIRRSITHRLCYMWTTRAPCAKHGCVAL